MKKINILIALAMFVSCVKAWASGFQVLEQGASNLGTALAGAVVNTNNDATAAYWNPSAAFFVESENKLDVAISIIYPEMKSHIKATHTSPYQPGTNIPTPGINDNAGKLAVIPNAYYVRKFGERFAGTLSITSPFGLATQYDEESNFIGRYDGVNSDIQTIQINPSLAYKVNDWLSLSVGASADYIHAELTSYTFIPQNGLPLPAGGIDARTRVDGSGWSGSFNVGATVKFLESGRFGISYRYQIRHDVEGYVTTSNPMFGIFNRQSASAKLNLPSNLNLGASYKFKDDFWNQFTVMAAYTFTWWSSFEDLDITNDAGGLIHHTAENWRNTHRASVGAAYQPDWNKDLTLRIGAAFDQSPVRNAKFRTVRVPDTNRIWATCGLGYKIGNMNFDLAYMHIFFDDANINNTQNHAYSSSTIKGYYDGCAHVVSMQVGVKW